MQGGEHYAALLEKLEGIEKLVEQRFDTIEKHFKRLNGQTSENTAFRHQGKVYVSILGAIGVIVMGLLVEKIIA